MPPGNVRKTGIEESEVIFIKIFPLVNADEGFIFTIWKINTCKGA